LEKNTEKKPCEKIISEIEKKDDVSLDLSDDVIEWIDKIAEKTNSTRDEVINQYLLDIVSTEMSLTDFKKLSEEEIKDIVPIILEDESGIPIARVTHIKSFIKK